ncbi:MAG: hypothetical protein J5501_08610 [Ruminococcus sp.]|nr:hypothetical protein [Ruminococcus sp.]
MKEAEELADKYPAMYRESYKYDEQTTLYARSIIENKNFYLPVTLPYDVISVEKRFAGVSGTEMEDLRSLKNSGSSHSKMSTRLSTI